MPTRTWPLLLVSLGLCGPLQWAHGRLLGEDGHRPAVPSLQLGERALGLCSLTYHAVASDLFYLRAVNAFGTRAEHRRHYPTLSPLLWRASWLDARAIGPYFLTASAMIFGAFSDPGDGLRLLARGSHARPDVWRLSFLLGYHLFEQGDLKEAARAMAQAAAHNDAPPFLAPLAARLAAESGDAEMGLALVSTMAATIDDEGVRAALLSRQRALVYQRDVARLDDANERYRRAHGHFAGGIAQLRHAEPTLPTIDPWGLPYSLAADGRAWSDNQAQRLQVHAP